MEGWRSYEGDRGAEGEAEQLDRVCNFGSRWALTTVSSCGAEGRRGGDGFAGLKKTRRRCVWKMGTAELKKG